MTLFPEIQLTLPQAEAIARGLYAIARADGLHERETALISSFWADQGGRADSLSELARSAPIGRDELGSILDTPTLRQLFIKTALLLIFSDERVSDNERALLREYTNHFGMQAELPEYEYQVKDYLLAQFSHERGIAELVDMAKKLSL